MQLNQTCLHRLQTSFWFLNCSAGAGEKVTDGDCTQLWKSQGSSLSQNQAPQNIMCVWSILINIFSWKRQFRVSRSLLFNRLWSSKVRATILALRSMDEAGSCPQVKPGGANHDRKLIRQWSGNLLSTWAADTLQAPWWPRLDVNQLRIEFFPWQRQISEWFSFGLAFQKCLSGLQSYGYNRMPLCSYVMILIWTRLSKMPFRTSNDRMPLDL